MGVDKISQDRDSFHALSFNFNIRMDLIGTG